MIQQGQQHKQNKGIDRLSISQQPPLLMYYTTRKFDPNHTPEATCYVWVSSDKEVPDSSRPAVCYTGD